MALAEGVFGVTKMGVRQLLRSHWKNKTCPVDRFHLKPRGNSPKYILKQMEVLKKICCKHFVERTHGEQKASSALLLFYPKQLVAAFTGLTIGDPIKQKGTECDKSTM